MNIFTMIAAAALVAAPFAAFADDAEPGDVFSKYITRPAESEDLDSFNGQYYIGFPDAAEIDDNYSGVTLVNTTTGATYKAMTSMASEIAGSDKNGVYYIFSFNAITEKGEYEVNYPVGAFTINGEKNPAFSTHFTIGMPQQGEKPDPVDPSDNPLSVWTITPDPEQTQLELPEVEIEFPELGDNNIFGPWDGIEYSLKDDDGKYYAVRIGTDYIKFTVFVEENLFNGTYHLTLGEGLFELLVDDDLPNPPYCPSPEIKVTYVIDNGSIVMAVENAESYDVTDLNGRTVLSAAPASELSTLPAGIYVINGKKVAVRR